jgi:hypothetical protein
MTGQSIIGLGTFAKGAIPRSLQITMEDSDGNALDLTSFTPDFVIEAVDAVVPGLGAGLSSLIDAVNGITQYDWTAVDFGTVGLFRGQMWVDDGTLNFPSVIIQYEVEEETVAP